MRKLAQEWVVPYVDENKPRTCAIHQGPSIVGIVVHTRLGTSTRSKSHFVCLSCICASMNDPKL